MPYIELDALDLKILAALQQDGRLTNAELADTIGLSASPCLRRVRRLEEEGFIRTYRAVLDREAIGLGLTVFVEIKLDKPTRENAQALHEALLAMPEVVNCHVLSGAADCLAEVVVPNVKAFEALVSGKLMALPMIGGIRSNIALKRVKSEGALPLDHIRRDPAPAPKREPDCV
jgi:Lrp/AsnC family leucine-responsive transcriptional regulator